MMYPRIDHVIGPYKRDQFHGGLLKNIIESNNRIVCRWSDVIVSGKYLWISIRSVVF